MRCRESGRCRRRSRLVSGPRNRPWRHGLSRPPGAVSLRGLPVTGCVARRAADPAPTTSCRRRIGPATRRAWRGGLCQRPHPTGCPAPAGTLGHRGRSGVLLAPPPVPCPARSPSSPVQNAPARRNAGTATLRRAGPDGHHGRDLRRRPAPTWSWRPLAAGASRWRSPPRIPPPRVERPSRSAASTRRTRRCRSR